MPLSTEAKQLNIVFKDGGYTHRSFAKAVGGITYVTIGRMLRGESDVSKKVRDFVCVKLGYSPEWFINGNGRSKIKEENKEGKKLLTELEQLNVQIDISNQLNAKLQARMEAYEKENEDLQKENDDLKKRISEIEKYLNL